MMKVHNYNFDGGEALRKIGAAWFVSYAYYEKRDRTHTNWMRVKTTKTRSSNYERSREYHKFWLNKVLLMNDEKLNRNTLGLNASDIKDLAKKL